MAKPKEIKVVDLFAGPGGLGEGFSAFSPGKSGHRPFRIGLSAEMDTVARKTLRLRAFFRNMQRAGEIPQTYYDYIAGLTDNPYDEATEGLWNAAGKEALCVTLGSEDGDIVVDRKLAGLQLSKDPWVLVGGPPCQAYSLVGRARNRGIVSYIADEDSRHFLYQDYLRIIALHQPTVFVMENVKGILSARIGGEFIFHRILGDLAEPGKALDTTGAPMGLRYRLYSLTTDDCFDYRSNIEEFDPRHFVVQSEEYGVPQKRHRVFILGVRSDIKQAPAKLVPAATGVSCRAAIGDLPRLRSGLSKEKDEWGRWRDIVVEQGEKMIPDLALCDLDRVADTVTERVGKLRKRKTEMGRNAKGKHYVARFRKALTNSLAEWYRDDRLMKYSNHETRGHIAGDLGRYLFCASYAESLKTSPKAGNFPDSLAPAHANWNSGKFADRFRVQMAGQSSSTITSHISKDGHYFIHYDASQCRSLTVREAARLQTFPDNYFFEGNRTQQYVQVGNAVPPYLARQIAQIVYQILY